MQASQWMPGRIKQNQRPGIPTAECLCCINLCELRIQKDKIKMRKRKSILNFPTSNFLISRNIIKP